MRFSITALKRLLLAGAIGLSALLTACGGGGAGGSTNTGGGTTTTTASPALTLTLTDSLGSALTTLSTGTSGTLTATVKDKNGVVVSGALVSFLTDATYGSFNPTSGTTLTNSSGVATMLISGGATSGASTATATAVWKESGADVSISGSSNYLVSAAGPAVLTITAPAFGATPLSAYGTTSVSVTVSGSTSPLNVAFSSTCASSGKAILTPSVTTISGVATASYRDNGCGNTDTVTATVTTGVSSTGQLVVSPPSAGSIQFVSATPATISLKGTGSASLQETSVVKFKILDTAGNPVSKLVNFTLSTTLAGITLSSASATSDASTGEVQTVVQSGTLPTPVRVIATINGTAIKTQSNQLTITTGLPDQAHTTLSLTTFNIDGWRFDGTTTTLTMRLADRLSNPVPDGTVVNFVAEGGRVGASCATANSECAVVFTSQAIRPSNGRVTVLAYTVGEESFTDANSNGTADAGELIDSNGASTDLPEAWVDYDEDGCRRDGAGSIGACVASSLALGSNTPEPYFDFDGSSDYSLVDGKYNGVLCTAGAGVGICSSRTTAHIYRNTTIVLSDSAPLTSGTPGMFRNSGNTADISSLDLGGASGCATAGSTHSFLLLLRDLNGNALPAGTTVTTTSNNGTILLGSGYVVPNTTASFLISPASSAFVYPIIVKNDSPTTTPCTDTTPSGVLTVTIDPPVGATTTYSIGISN